MKLSKYRHRILQLIISVVVFTCVTSLSYAQTFDPNLHIEYQNRLLTLSAQQADLKNILLEISNKTGIYVRFPSSLKKQITTKMSHVSLRKALVKLLKGTNYAIIYSGSGKNHAVVSKVFVYTKSERPRISGRSIFQDKSQDNRIAARIKTYEKRIELMNKKLSHLDENSRIAKRYVKQIRAYEKNIENLKKRIR
jgi:hypothetical protein